MKTKGSLMRVIVRTVCAVLCAAVLCFLPARAWAYYWADNFNDGIIDPNWAYDANNPSQVSLNESDARLNFTASSSAYYDYALYYVNDLLINFSNDFDIIVQGYDSYTGANRAGLEFGLLDYNGGNTATIYAYESLYNLGSDKMLDAGIRGSGATPDSNPQDRSGIDGSWGKIWYLSSTDDLYMGFYDGDPNGGGTLLNSIMYNNFNTLYNPGAMRVYLAGLSYVAPVGYGNMYYDNFSVNVDAPPVPEPSSFLLFAIGGLAAALFRRKKQP